MKKINIILVSLMLVALIGGCKRQKKQEGISFEIDWMQQPDDSLGVYLTTYGAKDIVTDTLLYNRKGRIKVSQRLDRDTIDIFLLKNIEGELLLPIFPHQLDDISIRYDGDSLYLDGIKYQEQIHRYRLLLEDCTTDVTEEMLSFLQEENREPVTLLLIRDLISRFPETTCRRELRRIEDITIRISTDLAQVIGANSSLFGAEPRYEFPNFVSISGEDDSVDLKKKMGKKSIMAVALIDLSDADSLQLARIKKYHKTLDSLGIPSLNVLPFVDSLPDGWKVKTKGTWRYYMVDSLGSASNFFEAYGFSMPPVYMLVDSTMQIWRSWEEPDSLIHFMKSYNEGMKKPKKK